MQHRRHASATRAIVLVLSSGILASCGSGSGFYLCDLNCALAKSRAKAKAEERKRTIESYSKLADLKDDSAFESESASQTFEGLDDSLTSDYQISRTEKVSVTIKHPNTTSESLSLAGTYLNGESFVEDFTAADRAGRTVNGKGDFQIFSKQSGGSLSRAYLHDPESLNRAFDYFTFGGWLEGEIGPSGLTGGAGGFVVGYETKYGDRQQGGTAVYRGKSFAVGTVSGGGRMFFAMEGSLVATADFTNQTIKGSLSNFVGATYDQNGTFLKNDTLPLTVRFTGGATEPTFRPTVLSGSTTLEGGSNTSGAGKFSATYYGPYSAELGGVWHVDGQYNASNTISMGGSFGGSR